MANAPKQFFLGEVRVDVAASELHTPRGRVRLEPKAMAVLDCLARRPGEIVTKEEIRADVWNGSVVVDEALQRIISLLRKALGDTPRAPRFIETIPKKGYRLIVTPTAADAKLALSVNDRRNSPRRALALKTAGGLVAGAVFAAGFAMAIFSAPQLPRNTDRADFGVIARAEALYERYRYEDNENAIELFQRAIDEDQGSARARAGLANALAQRFYLWSGGGDDLRRALAAGREAVRRAPDDARSHKALGLALEYAGEHDAAIESYLTTLELDPKYWPAIVNIGDIYFDRGEYRLARNWFVRAHEVAGDAAQTASKIGKAEMTLGRFQEASHWFSLALAKHPLEQSVTAALARAELYSGDRDAAQRRCEVLLSRLPRDPHCGVVVTNILLSDGDWAGAERALQNFASTAPPKWAEYIAFRRVQIAYLKNAEQPDGVLEFVRQMEAKRERRHADRAYWALAGAYALLGDKEKAFAYLDAARQAGWNDWNWDLREPAFEGLRNDGRFSLYLAAFEVESRV